jgi:Kef-type K+ transport system membrane component KefB
VHLSTELANWSIELDTLALVGITIVAAFLVGQILRRLGIPQVVGFIVGGMLLGPSFLHLISLELNSGLDFISEVALGLIGFEMGGQLCFSDLRKMGKSILLIVLIEAFGAFALVGLGVYLLTGSLCTAMLFGALASATAPAATVDVLAEYGAKGPLTTTLLAVVGLDDAISLLLFSVAAALATSSLSGEPTSLMQMVVLPFTEIGGSVLVGLVFGLILNLLMERFHLLPREHDAMVIPVGVVFICSGLARALNLSPILTAMVLGLVVINRNSGNGKYIRSTIERAGPVVYLLFFALAGARLRIDLLPTMGLLGIAYIVLRSGGKYAGVWLGGALGNAEPVIRNNLGLALLSQAGIAIGLALESHARFSELGEEGQALGSLILSVITATTLVVQIVGPIGVKFAITRAGEVGDVTWGECEPDVG